MIQSRQNSRVRELRSALSARRASADIAVEGVNLLREALNAAALAGTVQVQTVYLREDKEALVDQLPDEIEVVLLSHDAFESAAATEHSQGVAALVRYEAPAYVPRAQDVLLIAAGVQDPGNLGTLIRSAEAFGAVAVVLLPGTVDPWNGKALRASAGSSFRLPLIPWSDDLLAALREARIPLWAALPSSAGTVSAANADLSLGCGLVIGNEGSGISKEIVALCDGQITLPMAGPTESLNAAVAGSVLLYEAARQRLAKTPAH